MNLLTKPGPTPTPKTYHNHKPLARPNLNPYPTPNPNPCIDRPRRSLPSSSSTQQTPCTT